ncbi:MAG: hypothetical protein P8189_25960 [Anaerolineae bacterium]|jgi:hypothetical protein
MQRTKPTIRMIISCAALSCAVLVGWLLLGPEGALAQPIPETPTPTPITPTPTPTTPSPTPTTPTPTPTTPTPTPTAPSPTPTPVTPSPTSTPKTPSPTPRYTNTPTSPSPAQPQRTPQPPDPACQSVVEGYVIDATGERTTGATVLIEGEGWSSGMLTDDQGHYGFGGLCAGTATLQAFLPDGQASQSAWINLNGQEIIRLNLSVLTAGAATGSPAPQQSPTAEPNMPATGYSGLLLAGAALLGALLLLLAGTRRALGVRERTKHHD